ncbi:MAG: tRNA uridine-5-carboxymethylaminomethyl(34) synthesis enzyme MnmG [Candidatus Marinimicrobia bacterium]|jgi:tRNA uridine 5-carboxymethylaminomethyl modification enzyme|nr:tRNA uridine-5-carboxymethylaminomethyl(34) synthesis enzyme MnmG [Candidatus Neomarinimicrobiota bacterium]|tara:strand:+ start:1301 stop:3172 length:1872 start_codon:yes stop_codon:yes gene_type:complete
MNKYDVIVVGGGHAGVEAALAASGMGCSVALVTIDINAIARMSCNPAIGGLAKGHLVREIDALGGIMGVAADASGIQFKMLNKSKGRAVWSPRAQIDKKAYVSFVGDHINSIENIRILESEVNRVLVRGHSVAGVVLSSGASLHCRALVLTCGTFLNGLIHVGRRKIRAGRMGEEASTGITESLVSLGLRAGRLKTGTPPRLVRESINWSELKVVSGDMGPRPFSFKTSSFSPPNEPCHIIKTNPFVHDLIRENLHMSPLYCGEIRGVGPRYCPSIEDKVVRFPDNDAHQIFLEPEWRGSKQIYTNGFSTSLPEELQLAALRLIPGLENVSFFRPGYAIEYDFFFPSQLNRHLQLKDVSGLFLSGQINGTSGYEEAASQGLIAGINAANLVLDREPISFSRDKCYIGVLIDDLVTKDTQEPYRMFTARAEYRLLLRHTNADLRLSEVGHSLGLVCDSSYDLVQKKGGLIKSILSELSQKAVKKEVANTLLSSLCESAVNSSTTLYRLLKRPPVSISLLQEFNLFNTARTPLGGCSLQDVLDEVETSIKYEGYIKQQYLQVENMRRGENTRIPESFNFSSCISISSEAKEKLSIVRPETLGQASRISGVSPSDVAALTVLVASL